MFVKGKTENSFQSRFKHLNVNGHRLVAAGLRGWRMGIGRQFDEFTGCGRQTYLIVNVQLFFLVHQGDVRFEEAEE